MDLRSKQNRIKLAIPVMKAAIPTGGLMSRMIAAPGGVIPAQAEACAKQGRPAGAGAPGKSRRPLGRRWGFRLARLPAERGHRAVRAASWSGRRQFGQLAGRWIQSIG